MAHQLTPRQALDRLLDGNQRFIRDEREHPHQDAQRRSDLAAGQHPFAVLFGCGDSRLAAEIIFDTGLGDLFVVRTAGHVAESAVIGSLEYPVVDLDTPLIVVLGHDSCGAVTATVESVTEGKMPPGYVRNVVERIMPSTFSKYLPDQPMINDIVKEHTRQSAERLLEQSHIIADAVRGGTCAVVGMFYHLADGEVEIVFAEGNLKK